MCPVQKGSAMEIQDYLTYLADKIPTVTAAVTDGSGQPLTCALDIASCSKNGIYLFVPKHTAFYQALSTRNYLSFTGIYQESPHTQVSLSFRGHVTEKSPDILPRLPRPSRNSCNLMKQENYSNSFALFLLAKATGEWHRMYPEPDTVTFSFSSGTDDQDYFFITSRCVLCRLCASRCPQKCIDISQRPARIIQENCIRCGTCYDTCLAKAIIRQTKPGD